MYFFFVYATGVNASRRSILSTVAILSLVSFCSIFLHLVTLILDHFNFFNCYLLHLWGLLSLVLTRRVLPFTVLCWNAYQKSL